MRAERAERLGKARWLASETTGSVRAALPRFDTRITWGAPRAPTRSLPKSSACVSTSARWAPTVHDPPPVGQGRGGASAAALIKVRGTRDGLLLAAADEVLRLLDSVQLTENKGVATPVNWRPGESVIIPPSVSDEAAREKYPAGWETVKP